MYPVSKEYQERIKELTRTFMATVEIQHSSGTLTLTDKDIVGGSMIYNESSQAGEEFTIGGTVASDFSIKIFNKTEYKDVNFEGATVIPTIGLLLDEDRWEYVPLGRFNIDEVNRLRNTIEIKAIDNMIKLDKPYSLSKLSYPATLYQIYTNICDVADVNIGTPNFTNKDYVVKERPDGDLTFRDVLGYVAELSGSFAKCNRNGSLELRWYEPTGLVLDGSNRFNFTPRDDKIQITGIMATIEAEDDIEEDGTYLAGTDEYAVDLTENPLLQGEYEVVLRNIYEKVRDTAFYPYESSWQGNPAIQAGDIITQIDINGRKYPTLVNNSTYKYRVASTLSAKGLPIKAKGYKGSTNKKIAQIKRKIDKEVGDKLTTLEQQQLQATELIANMLGGYVIKTEEAFYISDNEDLSKAKKVWKWGIGGFGYSENGIKGPYRTSITADGSIVAMLVAANIITADMVRTGLLQSEDGSTWINLDNGNFNFKNALKWTDGMLNINSPDIPNTDDIVLQDAPYNNVKISAQKGLEVMDNYNRQRVQLGNYTFGKYGLLLKDSSGTKTILDEDGMLQSWQEGKIGNVDEYSPLTLNIYVPENTRYISKALLRFKMENFRAYSKSAISTEESTISSQSSEEFSTTSASGGGGTKTTHGGVDVEWTYPETQLAGDPPHTHTYKRVQSHAHDIILEDHTHEIKIPPHEHEIIIPPHEHDIEYGIFEGDMPSNITITINGTGYTRYLGGRDGFNEDRDDLDITTLLEKGTWNTIEIGSSTMGRIDASIFIQCFMNTIRNSVILDETYLKTFKIRTGMGLGEVSVAPRRTQLHNNPDAIFEAHVIRNTIEATTKEWRTLDIEGWQRQFTIENVKSVALAFDGNWAKDELGKYQFLTDDKPYIFWINEEGRLFVRLWDEEDTVKELAQDVVKVKALRGWKNVSVSKNDYGLIVAYIKTDGKVCYRNYSNQGSNIFMWEDERQIEEFAGIAKDISLFNTNDYRTGLMIEDKNGKIAWLITSRNWAGMALAPERITVKPNINVDFIKTTKHKGYCAERITSKPNIALDFLYASSFNEFKHIENIDDGTGNFGIKVKIKTKYGLYNCLSSEFKLTDSDGVSFNCEDIENISPNELVLTFMDFNNAVGEVKLSYVRTSGTNEAGYAFDNFEGTFMPTGLIPVAIPVPEVEVIWNE